MRKRSKFKKTKSTLIDKIIFVMLSLGAVTTGLTGCAGMNSTFSCNAKAGDSCMPVDLINMQAEAGVFNREVSSNKHEPLSSPSTTQVASTFNTADVIKTALPGKPIRYRETVQRIWVAPFEDTMGTYHESSYVYTVLKGSHWLGFSPEKVNASNELSEANEVNQIERG